MLACAALLLTIGERLANGDFDAPPVPNAIANWELEFGARNGGTEPASRLELDETVKHSGRASLHLAGDDKVRGWRAARQEIDGRPGATYTLSAFVKTKDVRSEPTAGTQFQQYKNAYVSIFLRGSDGQIVAKNYLRATLPSGDWEELTAKVQAPETTRSAEVYVFLSMSGEMWVDDIRVDVEGGKALPAMETVLREGFDKSATLPEGWAEALGASTAAQGPRSKIEIDPAVGEPGSPGSLHFSADSSTNKWFACSRTFEARPGDMFQLGASFKTLDVRKEGIQFQNLHVSLTFQGTDGHVIGSPVYAQGPTGTSDWKRAETKAVCPEGATKVELAAFLSMSGDAWIDRIQLERRGGTAPAYESWLTMDSKHVVVRYPKDHPHRSDMRAYAQKLDAAYEAIRTKLAVSFEEKVTVYVYDSADQGRRFTGRTLAFAAVEDRAVHLTMENSIAHELVHVLAASIGYAQVPLFGEGLAVWLDGESEASHHDVAAKMLREGRLPSLEVLLSGFREDEGVSYPAAGSFAGFVIGTAGLEAFKRLYVAPDPRGVAREVLGMSLEEVDGLWRKSLEKR
jgi:hypothetical protein